MTQKGFVGLSFLKYKALWKNLESKTDTALRATDQMIKNTYFRSARGATLW